MMKSVWTAVFSVGVSSCFAMAEEPKTAATQPPRKVVDLYNQYMDTADWQMAELIALGAREKFGEDLPIIQRMLVEVEKAKGSAPAAEKAVELPAPPEYQGTFVCTYSIAELIADHESEEVATLAIIKKARLLVDDGIKSEAESNVGLYRAKKVLVVSTTQQKHNAMTALFKELRAAKDAAPTKLAAK